MKKINTASKLSTLEYTQIFFIFLGPNLLLIYNALWFLSDYPNLYPLDRSFTTVMFRIVGFTAMIFVISYIYFSFFRSLRIKGLWNESYSSIKTWFPVSLVENAPTSLKYRGIEWNLADKSVGASIIFGLRPKLVLSGGMYVALNRNDSRAISIVLHEYAHIKHWDFLQAGIVFTLLIGGFGSIVFTLTDIVKYGLSGVVNYIIVLSNVLTFFISLWLPLYFVKRREFFADFFVYCVLGKGAIISSLTESYSNKKSIFHPSLSDRIQAAKQDYKNIKRALIWRSIIVFQIIFTSITLYLSAPDLFASGAFLDLPARAFLRGGFNSGDNWASFVGVGSIFSYFVCLFLELFRMPIARLKI